jgi:RNA polymerase-binding transcription factor DksA
MTHAEMSAAEREELRRAVIREMGNAAHTLEALKAGQNVTLATLRLPWEQRGLSRLERAQMVYDHLKAVLASFARGTYGCCGGCGAPLSLPELKEMPWADRCRDCGR